LKAISNCQQEARFFIGETTIEQSENCSRETVINILRYVDCSNIIRYSSLDCTDVHNQSY